MKYNEIKMIDFSQGIKSSEVMNNDSALQEQIERERLAIAGHGIGFGLEIALTDFNVSVGTGTIVDSDGIEKVITSKNFTIELPKIIMRKQKIYPTSDGMLTLEDIPYSIDRTETSECNTNSIYWGIDAYYEDNPGVSINISSVRGNIVYTNAKDTSRAVIINYNSALDRIDTIYIDDDYTLQVSEGVDSTTPSSYIPSKCKYVLGFIKVISKFYDESTGSTVAKAFIIKEFNNRRTVYTDINNNLYLCGIPFESLLRIYFDEPINPKEGMLWYDMGTNKLKVWRRTDAFMFTDILTYMAIHINEAQKFKTSVGYKKDQLSVYIQKSVGDENIWIKLSDNEIDYYSDQSESVKGTKESTEFAIVPRMVEGTVIRYTINRFDESYYWVPINDTSYMNALEYKIWCPSKDDTTLVDYLQGLNIEEMPIDRADHDLKNFIFNRDEMNLRFTPYKNELSIMVDQIPLHRDQFVEITVEDIINDKELTKMAVNSYGYTVDYLQKLKIEYSNIGLGFKFINALDRPGFIEVNIEHRVNDSMLSNKFQRSATFSKSETIIYDASSMSSGNITINTLIPYRYKEEQIDIYIDGRRIKKSNFEEIAGTEKIIGSMCKSFSINTSKLNIINGTEISYKITTTIYSYDHIESLIEESNKEINDKIAKLEETINGLVKTIGILSGN